MILPDVPFAVVDANVLYSASLRDLFMRLALEGLYVPRWTQEIQQEWIENVLANRPDLTRQQLERTRALMDAHAEGSLVTGYEHRIPALSLPDPADRHVLSAAIETGASVIVTFNLGDFPPSALESYGIEAVHPDTFMSALLEDASERFVRMLKELLTALKNPPKTLAQHRETLRDLGLKETARRLEPFV